jgi:hypothetical protein
VHLEYYYLFALAVAMPMAWIFKNAGFKPYWALLLAMPDVGLTFCILLLALRKWPKGAKV